MNQTIDNELKQWGIQQCRELWQLDDDHITIDIMIVDGDYVRYMITHETLGMTGYAESIEDAKRLLAAKKIVADTSKSVQNESFASAMVARA